MRVLLLLIVVGSLQAKTVLIPCDHREAAQLESILWELEQCDVDEIVVCLSGTRYLRPRFLLELMCMQWRVPVQLLLPSGEQTREENLRACRAAARGKELIDVAHLFD